MSPEAEGARSGTPRLGFIPLPFPWLHAAHAAGFLLRPKSEGYPCLSMSSQEAEIAIPFRDVVTEVREVLRSQQGRWTNPEIRQATPRTEGWRKGMLLMGAQEPAPPSRSGTQPRPVQREPWRRCSSSPPVSHQCLPLAEPSWKPAVTGERGEGESSLQESISPSPLLNLDTEK